MSIAINISYESLIITIKPMMVIDMITNPIICGGHTVEIKEVTSIRTYSRNRFIFSSTCPSLPLRVPRRNGMTLGQYGKISDCTSNLARPKKRRPLVGTEHDRMALNLGARDSRDHRSGSQNGGEIDASARTDERRLTRQKLRQ